MPLTNSEQLLLNTILQELNSHGYPIATNPTSKTAHISIYETTLTITHTKPVNIPETLDTHQNKISIDLNNPNSIKEILKFLEQIDAITT